MSQSIFVEDQQQVATVKINLEFEVNYNSFSGRELKDFGELIEEDLHSALSDFREHDVIGIYSQLESVDLIAGS